MWKRIFKSLGLRSLLTKKVLGIHNNGRNQRDAKKYARLPLFNFLLCQEKYHSQRKTSRNVNGNCRCEAVERFMRRSMFTLLVMENDENHGNVTWLMPEFQASLSGKKIPKPSRLTVTNILSKFGNTQRSWDLLFNSGACTMNQVLMNFRNLMFLNYPINKLREYWGGLSRGQAASNGSTTNDINFIVSLLKIRHLINLECDASYVARIVKKFLKVK